VAQVIGKQEHDIARNPPGAAATGRLKPPSIISQVRIFTPNVNRKAAILRV
jgi:hypothetical protein